LPRHIVRTSIAPTLYGPTADVLYDASGQKSAAHIELCFIARLAVALATVDNADDSERQILFLAISAITSATHFLEHLMTLHDVAIDEGGLRCRGARSRGLRSRSGGRRRALGSASWSLFGSLRRARRAVAAGA
jgi:hypothetical protein